MQFLCILTKLLRKFSVFPRAPALPREEKGGAASPDYQHCRRENPFELSTEKQGRDCRQTDEITEGRQQKYQGPLMPDSAIGQAAPKCS